MTTVEYSKIESETLDLKVGRCNSNYFDSNELYRLITQNGYDLCRIKVCAEDEYASLRLDKTGLPFFFSGSIRRYKTRITEKPSGEYNYSDLEWIEYDGTQNQLLKDMLIGTWGTYPIGYYRSPLLADLISKEVEIESVFKFYKSHNNPKENANNTIIFIKHGDNYIGFFALNGVNGNLESHVGGILEPYRRGGYFLDKLRFIKEYCIRHSLEHFIFGARNENSRVQQIFQHVGFEAVGSENVFHIASLLSAGREQESNLILQSKNENNIRTEIFEKMNVIAIDKLPHYSQISFNLNKLDSLDKATWTYTCPIVTQNHLLIVLKSLNEFGDYTTGYFKASN
jgi:hypothetical protein